VVCVPFPWIGAQRSRTVVAAVTLGKAVPKATSGALRILSRMTTSPKPLDVARAVVEPELRNSAQHIRWLARKWLSGQLVKLAGFAVASSGLVVFALPTAAVVSVAAGYALLVAFIVGQRIQYVRLETPTRWGLQIANRRLKRDVLKAELTLRQATLLLAGDPRDRQEQFRMHAPGTQDFVKVLRWERGRRAAAAAPQRPQPPKARVRQSAPPPAPDIASVRRRRDLIVRELAVLEEEIQALALPEDRERSELAAASRRVLAEERAAAHRQDREARDRARRGLAPPSAESGIALEVTLAPGRAGR
jgi:hypothetical protein